MLDAPARRLAEATTRGAFLHAVAHEAGVDPALIHDASEAAGRRIAGFFSEQQSLT